MADPYKNRDVLVPLSDPWDAQSSIMVMDIGAKRTFLRTSHAIGAPVIFETSDSPPTNTSIFLRPCRGTPAFDDLLALQHLVEKRLDEATNGTLRLDALQAFVSERMTLLPGFVEGTLRYFAAQGALAISRASIQKVAFDVKLSETARKRERLRAYGASFGHEVEVQSEQVGRVIGHKGVAGSYREELLRALVQRHIPQRFHAATGFIVGYPEQIDILIYDQIEYAPLFRADNLVVVPEAAVRAIIEVKTNLTKDELQDALKHLLDARPLRGAGPPVFTGIFGFAGAAVDTLIEGMRAFHAMSDDDTIRDFEINNLDSMVTAVCVLKQAILIPQYPRTPPGSACARLPAVAPFESASGRQFEAAVFFDLLSRFLRHPFDGARLDGTRGDLLDGDINLSRTGPLYDLNVSWGPYQGLDDEWTVPFEASLTAYNTWLEGNAWPSEEDLAEMFYAETKDATETD